MFKQRKGVSKSNGRPGARLSQKLMREKRNKGLQKWYGLLILRDRKAVHAGIGDIGEEKRKSFPRLSKPLTLPPVHPPARQAALVAFTDKPNRRKEVPAPRQEAEQ